MKNVNTKPSLIIVAGPNGAGKSTFITEFLLEKQNHYQILNYDMILKTLNETDTALLSLLAGKELLKTFNRYQKESVSFIYETVLSDSTKYLSNKINEMQENNWEVVLFYIWISSNKISQNRVTQRVESGGHSVPDELLKNRYYRSINNLFNCYMPVCHSVICYENDDSSIQIPPNLVFVKINDKMTVYDNMNYWRMRHL